MISVIIPVYNVKDYLRKAVESITSQTCRDLEIILVDDKATDGSAQLCDQLASEDPRIRVIHNEVNVGAGISRNHGIQAAKGEYITFLDADDYIDPQTYQTALDAMQSLDLDLVKWNFNSFVDEGRFSVDIYDGNPVMFTTPDQIRHFLLLTLGPSINPANDPADYGISFWFMVRRSAMADVLMLSERDTLSEDLLFTYDIARNSRRIACLPQTFYHHRLAQGSITFRSDLRILDKMDRFLLEADRRIKRDGLDGQLDDRIAMRLLSTIIGDAKAKLLYSKDSPTHKREWLSAVARWHGIDIIDRQYFWPATPRQRRLLFKAIKADNYQLTRLLLNAGRLLSRGFGSGMANKK